MRLRRLPPREGDHGHCCGLIRYFRACGGQPYMGGASNGFPNLHARRELPPRPSVPPTLAERAVPAAPRGGRRGRAELRRSSSSATAPQGPSALAVERSTPAEFAATCGAAAPVGAANPRVLVRRRRKAGAGALWRRVRERRALERGERGAVRRAPARRSVRRRSTANRARRELPAAAGGSGNSLSRVKAHLHLRMYLDGMAGLHQRLPVELRPIDGLTELVAGL